MTTITSTSAVYYSAAYANLQGSIEELSLLLCTLDGVADRDEQDADELCRIADAVSAQTERLQAYISEHTRREDDWF